MIRTLLALTVAMLAVPVLATPSATAADPACTGTPSVTLDDSAVRLGDELGIAGSGWCNGVSGGSVVAIKLDAGAFAHLDTTVHANKTIWAIVEAGADGTFDTAITLPDGTAATSSPVAVAGGPHALTLLTGSLKANDPVRSVTSASFDLLPAETEVDDPATWGFPLTAGTAKAWVQRSVSTGTGTLRIAGTGWTTGSGAPSTIAVKLGASETAQFERSTGILLGDATIWATPTVAADGSFDTTVPLPAGLKAGDYLTARLASGKFGAGDVQRSLLSPLLAIDGTTWTAPPDDADVVCTPTTASARVAVETRTVPLGGTLVLTGTGWCNPVGGGSRIGVKIDDGAYSHLDSSVHSNRTIWAIVKADAATGSFTARITLPDGTTRTSTPALSDGAHTLRLLSGSLKAGDPIRSLEADFVVGVYRPTVSPDPVAASNLTPGTRHGLAASRPDATHLRLTLPGQPSGTWVYVSAYLPDGSPRYPWAGWRRLDARHGVTLKVGASVPLGPLRLVVQSGEDGAVGTLLGWVRATPKPLVTRPTTVAPTVVALPAATLVTPARPAPSYDALATLPRHRVTAVVGGSVVTVTIPDTEPGATVFVTVYSPTLTVAGGWITLDQASRLRVDLAKLGTGSFRVVLQGEDGAMLGWAAAPVGVDEEAATTVDQPADVVATPTEKAPTMITQVASPLVDSSDGWLLGLGLVVLAGTGVTLLRTRERRVA